MWLGARQKFARGWSRFGRCCWELAESSPEVCREVYRDFADRLSGAREFTERMLEVCREFTEDRRKLVEGIGSLSRVFRKLTECIEGLSRVRRELAKGDQEFVGSSTKVIGSLPGMRWGFARR
ncbi:hypothetical protein BHE74_00037191 [Ensete ventricosum]|nr:hypothetical protein BHE74_00037191 [Ensete ventricosum]